MDGANFKARLEVYIKLKNIEGRKQKRILGIELHFPKKVTSTLGGIPILVFLEDNCHVHCIISSKDLMNVKCICF